MTPQIVMCTLLGIMESLTAVQDMVATNTFDHACVSSLLVVVVVVVSLFLFLSVSFVSPSFPPPFLPLLSPFNSGETFRRKTTLPNGAAYEMIDYAPRQFERLRSTLGIG